MSDKIKERIYIKGILNLQTPCMIGSGENNNTDSDVLVDSENKPFIPGTSLAGVFRSYLAKHVDFDEEEKELKYLFGSPFSIKNKNETTISNIYISDANCCDKRKVEILVRDGVELNEYKAAKDKSKYDYEVIKPNTKFEFHIEVILREKFNYYKNGKVFTKSIDYNKIKNYIANLLIALEEEKISIGSKTSRGFGVIKVVDVKVELIDDKDYQHYINFDFEKINNNVNYRDWIIEKISDNYYEIEVELELVSSLIIRDYIDVLDVIDAPDQIMLNVGDIPVIPGTSWAGCFRHHTRKLLEELDINIGLIDLIYGYVDKNDDKKSTYSKFSFIESEFENKVYRVVRRNKIDRFSGGAVDKALFNEQYLESGNTRLKIRVEKGFEDYIGILFIIIDEINNGLLALGGETSVGRGLFKVNDIKLNNEKLTTDLKDRYLSNFIQKVKKEGYYGN